MKLLKTTVFNLFFIFIFLVCTFEARAQSSNATNTASAPETQSKLTDSVINKEKWPTHLRMLTGPSGGQWFMLGEPIADTISANVLPTTSRTGGGLSNIEAINGRLGDLGFTLRCFMGAASSGEEEYKDISLDNTVIMANVYPQVLYFLVRKDFAEKHGIDSVETLLKKEMPLRFASLKVGTASEFILNMLLKYGYNTNFDQLRAQGWEISFNHYAETADNFVAEQIDCFAYTAGTEVPLILEMEKYSPIAILPIDQKVLDTLSKKFNTNTYTIEPGTYASVTKPVKTLGDHTCIVIRKDLPDDLVYEISKAIWKDKDKITAVVKDFGALSPETALEKNLLMHPGATAFWQSVAKEK